MSKLKELIEKLCPNGVEFKELQEICNVSIGEFVHKNKQREDAIYPVFNGGISNTGFYDEYNNEGNKVLVSARGANAGFVNKIETKYWAGNSCYSIEVKDNKYINWLYIYYFLKNNEKNLLGQQQTGSIPAISKKQIESFKIAVPPLEVQCEIVHILDELTLLSAELMAEQNARRIQYEYYRDNIFNNLDKYTKFSLGDIVEFINGRAYKQEELLDSGKYKVLRVGNFGTNDRWYYSNIELEDDKYCNKGDLLYLWSASFGPQIWEDEKTIFHYHIWKLRFNETEINKEFLYYFLDYDKENLKSLTTNSTMPHISMTNMKTRDIYLPPIEMQRKIVKYLNAFYTLANSNLSGLPAEIEARRKQYEYYRNKLLTFKRIGE